MSVSQTVFGAAALNWRSTRSSCTGGAALRSGRPSWGRSTRSAAGDTTAPPDSPGPVAAVTELVGDEPVAVPARAGPHRRGVDLTGGSPDLRRVESFPTGCHHRLHPLVPPRPPSQQAGLLKAEEGAVASAGSRGDSYTTPWRRPTLGFKAAARRVRTDPARPHHRPGTRRSVNGINCRG